jgi:hypothetical protein
MLAACPGPVCGLCPAVVLIAAVASRLGRDAVALTGILLLRRFGDIVSVLMNLSGG